MRLARHFRTAGFRLATFYALLFAISGLALFAVVRWSVGAAIDTQLRREVETELASLSEQESSAPSLAPTVEDREAWLGQNGYHYLLLSPDGRRLAGTLPAQPPSEGWQRIVLPEQDSDDPLNGEHVVRALGRGLPDGSFLMVGIDTYDLVELQESITFAFGGAAAAIVILAVGGGILASHGFLARIDAIERTSRAIIDGHLSDRIPVRGTDDELDRLSRNLNGMLDRIEALMSALRQVSNDIAHDLRTPLGRLRQKLESARTTPPGSAERDALLDEAIGDADSILATFSALLRIAQIESGSRRAGFQAVDLSRLVSDIASAFAAVAEDGGRSLEASVAPGVSVHGDRELLAQMLANLVENAIRHTSPGAHIRLDLEHAGLTPSVVVADDGPGIPPDARARVFGRFERLEKSRSTPGHGLGLSLVAAVAELHGIAIELQDNRPGLRFVMRFPAGRAGGREVPPSGSRAAPQRELL